MAKSNEIRVEDVMSVRNRIAWGAVLGGAVIAMSILFVMGLLGTVIGLSVGPQVSNESLTLGAAIWAIVTSALALFAGGYVATSCAAGENQTEAVIHGLATWGVVTTLCLIMLGLGVGGGLIGVAGLAEAAQATLRITTQEDWAAAAQRGGVPPETIAEWRQRSTPENVQAAVQDPQNREQARQVATRVSGWALGATLLAMVAAIGGALVGSGPVLEFWRSSLIVTTTKTRRERELSRT